MSKNGGQGGAPFEAALRESFDALRKGRGCCPETEALARLLGGELSEEEADRVRSHVASCGVCDYILERMRRFEGGKERADFPRGWRAAEKRLTRRFLASIQQGNEVPEQPVGPDFFGRLATVLRQPALAYAVVLLLIYPAYLGVSRRRSGPAPADGRSAPPEPSPAEAPLALQSLKVIDLVPVRSTAESARRIELSDGDKAFILSFFVPIRPRFRYVVLIMDRDGNVVAAESEPASYDGKGNFQLLCQRGVLGAAEYVLVVKEIDSKNGRLEHEFRFPFAL